MPQKKVIVSLDNEPSRPVLTPEARESQLINYAVDLAEKQLREGTASSQVITHYLKLASNSKRERLEQEILEKQKELLEAKTENIHMALKNDETYKNAIAAFKQYRGTEDEDEEILP